MESYDRIRRLPESGGEVAGQTLSCLDRGSDASNVQPPADESGRRERSPSEEQPNKRLRRLMRNRASAQAARDKKKAHLTALEAKIQELETKNAELQQTVSSLEDENRMLRQILENTLVD